MNINTN